MAKKKGARIIALHKKTRNVKAGDLLRQASKLLLSVADLIESLDEPYDVYQQNYQSKKSSKKRKAK
jgi:hypothetical protein